jgi:methylmalonyl-CoA mutase N-terminal domain/subunit
LHCNGMDEALAVPSEEAMQIALRTQQIIAEETGVINTIDPLGGSYFIENLSNELEEQAMGYIDEIERHGGFINCVEEGYFEQEIAASAYRLEQEKTSGERAVVGVNSHVIENEELSLNLMKVDKEVEKQQIEKVTRLRNRRDNAKVERLLKEIEYAAANQKSLMPILIEAAEAYATEGEMIGSLKQVFGEYVDPGVF